MSKDRRAAQRRGVTWRTLMIDASSDRPIGECTIVNVSASGARLLLESPDEAPASFVLVLSKNGRVRRRCELSWQEGANIGVRFVGPRRSQQAAALTGRA